MLGAVFQGESIKTAGIQDLSFLFPASLFRGFDDRVQKFQLLACGAVQILDPADDR